MIGSAIRRDERGVTILEFAFVAPVFLLMLMGLLDLGQRAYVRALLDGAVQDVARSATIEKADTSEADAMVSRIVGEVAPGATFDSERRSYYDFDDIARAERFTDDNDNGTCDAGEPYTDENRNSRWDRDMGLSGGGGANDVVIYSVTMKYEGLFASGLLPGSLGERTVTAEAVRKNQPFAAQQARGAEVLRCR